MTEKLNDIELQNVINVKGTITKLENPNPLTVVFIIIITLILLYFIFILIVTPNISGVWIDNNDVKHVIKHNKLTDNISIGMYNGTIKNNIINIDMGGIKKMGIWATNEIAWIDSTKWHCSHGY